MGSLRWEHPRHTSTKRSPHSRAAVRVASQVIIHWRDGTDCTSAQAVHRAICVLRAHTRNLKGGPLYALDGSTLPTTDQTRTATPVAKSEGGGKSKVKGSGKSSQAQAIRFGIARALQKQEPLLRPVLKKAGLLTRDSRVVERKKSGQKKARKKFTWVKR